MLAYMQLFLFAKQNKLHLNGPILLISCYLIDLQLAEPHAGCSTSTPSPMNTERVRRARSFRINLRQKTLVF